MEDFSPQFSYQMNADDRIHVTCTVCHHVIARSDDESGLKVFEETHDCVQLLLPHVS